jgi:hypothetical protein
LFDDNESDQANRFTMAVHFARGYLILIFNGFDLKMCEHSREMGAWIA